MVHGYNASKPKNDALRRQAFLPGTPQPHLSPKDCVSASQRRKRRTQPSPPVVPSTNVRTARHPATPGPTRALTDAAARPLTWCVFHGRLVPPLVSIKRSRSGAAKRHRWAALNPKRTCRTPINVHDNKFDRCITIVLAT
jgi:hypothetical protein